MAEQPDQEGRVNDNKPEALPLVNEQSSIDAPSNDAAIQPEVQGKGEARDVALDGKVEDAPPTPMPASILEDPRVLLACSCVDFVASGLFSYGCVMFVPVNMADPFKYLEGLNLFTVGILMYILLTSVFCRETLRFVGPKSMEFAELSCSVLAMFLFAVGLILFYPAPVLPRWMETCRKPLETFCTTISPEYMTHLPGSLEKDPGPQGFPLTAAAMFLWGSLFFCVAPMLHMVNMSNENLRDQTRDVVNQLIKGVAGVLFVAGTMFFIPGIGCNSGALALGAYLFTGASACFSLTATSDLFAAAVAVSKRRNSSSGAAYEAMAPTKASSW